MKESRLYHSVQGARDESGPAFFAYANNYLVDLEVAITVDVEATRAIEQAKVGAARTMIDVLKSSLNFVPSACPHAIIERPNEGALEAAPPDFFLGQVVRETFGGAILIPATTVTSISIYMRLTFLAHGSSEVSGAEKTSMTDF